MEELTPELERRIQVEELWGRRIVLEETMNAWRLREYQSRRLLCLLRDDADEVRVVRSVPLADRPKTRQPARHLNLVSLRRTAVVCGLVLLTCLAAQQGVGKFLTWGHDQSALHVASSPNADKTQTDVRVTKDEQALWKHSTEERTSKLRPLDADLKKIFGSPPSSSVALFALR